MENNDEYWRGRQEEVNFLPEDNWQIEPKLEISQQKKQPNYGVSKE